MGMSLKTSLVISFLLPISLNALANALFPKGAVILSPGFLTKVICEGRLLVSAIGNESLVELQALPKELGCAVLLKPKARSGVTNLFLETSSGSVSRWVEISSGRKPDQFEVELKQEKRE